MTKKTMKRGGRRALSIFMSLLMIMSAWVFVAPEVLPEASAITSQTAGKYYVKVYWHVDDDSNKNENTWKLNWRAQDGSTGTYEYGNNNAASSTGDKESSVLELSGVPYSIFYQLRNSGGFGIGGCGWYIKKITIANNNSMTGAVSLWEGTLGCKCENITAQTINVTYNIETNTQGSWSNGNGSNKTQSTSYLHDPFRPTPSCTYSGHTVVGLNGAQETRTYSIATAKDQYGVNWGFNSVTWASSNTTLAPVSTSNGNCTATFKLNNEVQYNVTLTPTLVHTSGNKTPTGLTVTVDPGKSMSLNTQYNVSNNNSSSEKWYAFKPSETGTYIFFSWFNSGPDVNLNLYQRNTSNNDELGSPIAYADDYASETWGNHTGNSSTYSAQNKNFNGGLVQKMLGSDYHPFYCVVNLTKDNVYLAKVSGLNGTSIPFKVCKAVNITFNATGGLGKNDNDADVTSMTVPMPVGHTTMKMNQTGFTRTGHTLLAWSTQSSATQPKTCWPSDTITVPSSATTYYALWNPNNGTPTDLALYTDYTANIDHEYKVQFYQFIPPETGYYAVFSHNSSSSPDPYLLLLKKADWASSATVWKYNDNGNGNNQFYLSEELTKDVPYLIAVKLQNGGTGTYPFRIESVFKVKYYGNGGSDTVNNVPAEQDKRFDVNLTLQTGTPTRTGYTFQGWATHPSATTVDYASGATYTANANLDLYAVWTPNQSTLTVNPNGGVWNYYLPDGSPFTGSYQDTLSIPDPTRVGYTFSSWTLGGSGNGTFNSSSKIFTFGSSTAARTLTATWERGTYSVTYPGAHTSGTPTTVQGAAALNATVTAAADYHLTDNVTVKVGSKTLTRGTDYTYTLSSNHRSATVAINADLIGDNVTINAVAEACSGGTATCTQAATCSVCNTSYGSVDSNNHNWDYANATFNWSGYTCPNATVHCTRDTNHTKNVTTTVTSVTTAPAVCNANGTKVYTAKFIANNTEYTSTKTETLTDTANHDYITVASASHLKTAATCTTAAVYYKYCSRCGANHPTETFTSGNPDVNAHAWGNWTQVDENTHKRVCANSADHVQIENHSWTAGTATPATCTTAGSQPYTCATCGGTKTETIPALGHNFTGAWTVRTAATCTTAGVEFRVCARTGCSVEETRAIPATGHTLVTVQEVAPTCTTPGTYSYTYCSTCKQILIRNNVDVSSNNWTTTANASELVWADASAHNYGDWTVKTAATCTADGVEERVCSYNSSHKDTRAIPALGHDIHMVAPVNPTCQTSGNYAYTYCARCNKILAINFADVTAQDITYTAGTTPSQAVWTDANAHNMSAFTETAAATCTTDGVMTATCRNSGCSHTETKVIPKLGHDWGDWSVTTPATCTTDGVETRVCGNDSNHTETRPVPKTGHNWTAWAVQTAATCTANGTEERHCQNSGCSESETRTIPKLDHNWSAWTTTEANHTRTCSVGGETETAAHTWTNIVDPDKRVAGTDCTTGVQYYKTCSVCGYTSTVQKFAVSETVGHKLVEVAATAATCEAAGNIHYWKCAVCGKYFSDAGATTEITAAQTVEAAQGHNFDLTATPIEVTGGHQYPCTRCGGYGFGTTLGAVEAHTFDQEVTGTRYSTGTPQDCTHPEVYYKSCKCGAVGTTTFQANGSLGHSMTAHPAVAATCAAEGRIAYWECSRCHRLFSDANGTTEVRADALSTPKTTNHSFGDWTTLTAATCTEQGSETRTCSVCGKVETRTTDALTHSFTSTTYRTNNDGTHNVKCTRCDVYGPDVSCTNTTSTSTAADCLHKGTTTYTCADCGGTWTVEGAYGSHVTTNGHHAAVPATCTATGTVEYWTCSVCNKYFSDAAGSHELSLAELTAPVLGHQLTMTPASEENCTTAGNSAYYTCARCGKYFSDANGQYEIEEDSWVIPATGHDYTGTIRYVDANNHEFLCKNGCGTYGGATAHVYDKAVATDTFKVSNATCTAAATYHYSCECGAAGTATFTVGDPLGHAYNSVKANSWVWTAAGDGYTAKATLICANDNSHEIERDAVVTYTTNGATCGAAGTITYTATVTLDNGSKATDTKTETVEALPHSYDLTRATYTWTASGDTYSVTATVPCTNNASHPALTETVTATKVNTPATCEAPGSNVFTATFTKFPTQTRTDVIPKLGHAYGQPTWTWAANNLTATATFTCANDSTHKMVITTATTESVTLAATCTVAGTKDYTATVSFDRDGDGTPETYTDSKTNIAIPALGHDFSGAIQNAGASGHNYACVNTGCNAYGYNGVENDVEAHTYDKAVATADYKVSDATCTAAATYYYSCECGAAGTSTFTVGNPLGHAYNSVKANSWVWTASGDGYTAKATLICANDNSHEIERNAIVTYTTDGATCGAAGTVHYTATVTLDNGSTATDTKDETVAALPHSYDLTQATYTWTASGDTYSVTATVPCTNNASHPALTETVTATKVNTPATCEVPGSNVFTAAFTKFPTQTRTDPIAALGHTWSAPVWTWGPANLTATATFTCGRDSSHKQIITVEAQQTVSPAPTCTTAGTATYDATVTFEGRSYNATTSDNVAALGHDWGEWTVTTEATCDHAGVETRECQRTGCDARETRPITQLTHKLVFVPAVAPTCTTDGSIAHYECALCGKYFSDQAGETELTNIVDPMTGHDFTGAYRDNGDGTHSRLCVNGCGEYGATVSHSFDQQNNGAIYAKDGSVADCTHQGEFYYSCLCGKSEGDDNHTFAAGGSLGHVLREFPAVAATCKDDGHNTYWYCSRCGNYYKDANANQSTTLAAETISHTTIAHTMPETWTETVPATCTEDGLASRVCTVCGVYTETQPIAALGHDFEHGTVYQSYNDGTHAVKCSRCSVYNPTAANCADTKTIVTTTAADCTHLGTTTYRCTCCGYEWTEENTGVGPHSSTPTHHDAVAATCTTAGNIEYWTCEICGQNFSDETCTTVAADVTTAPLAHAGIAAVAQQDADCTHDGVKAHFECPICHKLFSDVTATREVIASDLVIPALGHNFYGAINNVDENGHNYACTRTGCTAHGIGTTENATEAHTFDRAIVSDATLATAATCEAKATYYYTCECGEINSASGAATFESGNPTGHAYNSVKANSWVWTEAGSGYTAKATLVCANDANHEIPRDAIVTYTTVGASCTGEGTITYTATITLDDGTTATDTKTDEVAVLGHDFDYANTDYVWNEIEGGWECTATATCKRDGCSATDTETVTAVLAHTNATCENEGSDVYTATFTNTNFKTQTKTVVITRLGHDYQIDNTSWSWNAAHTAATVTFVCQNDSNHTLEVMTDNITEARTPATCEQDGSVTYTATLVYGGQTYTNTTDPETISATGHAWGDPVWTWTTPENSAWTATVSFTCANDNSHVETPTVTVTNVATAATCTTDGSVVYTATATFLGETYTDTQTKTKDNDVSLAAFGHNWGDWTLVSTNNYSRTCANDTDHVQSATIVGSNLTATVAAGQNFVATITADTGYKLTDAVSVYVGTEVLGTYTYLPTGEAASKTLTINADDCTGNITVNVTAVPEGYTYDGYKLELDANSFISGSYTIEQGANLAAPTRTGYDFGGWKVKEAVGNWTVDDQTYTAIPTGKYGNVVFTAVWTAHTYTVAYDTDGGSAAPASFTKTYDVNATLSDTIPTKDGYTFGGWSVGGDTYAASATLNKDYATEAGATVTLTAIWTTNGYEIAYDGGTGASNVPANTAKQYGVDTALSSQVPTKTAYTFSGWKLGETTYNAGAAAGAAFDAAYLTDGSPVTVTAQWTADTYTATFNYNNGSNSTTTSFTVEDTVSLTAPTKDGYTFAGWKITAAAGDWALDTQYAADATAAGANKYGDVTFTAQWTANDYTYTLLPNGGTLAASVTNPGSYNATSAAITLPSQSANTITRTGYSFAGWKVKTATGTNNWDVGSVIYNIPTGKYGNVELEAVWTNNDFNVTFDGNGNTNTNIQMPAQQFRSGVAQTLNPNQYEREYAVTFEENGGSAVADATVTYQFQGWATSANGAKVYDDNDELTLAMQGELALYAVWQSASTTLPAAPSKTGYTFAGWYTTDETVLTQPGATFTPTEDTTFYAKWTANDFTVTFAKGHDDATGEMANQTITADTATNLTANAFTRSYEVTYVTDGSAVTDATVDYTFAGWLDQDGNAYADKASISMARDDALNLTAQWTANSTELPATTKDGYTFAGWYNGDDKVEGTTFTPTADTTLTAHWDAISYTATFVYDNGDNNTTTAFTKEDAVTLTAPTKNGYTFAGWKITAASGSWVNGTQYQATDASIAAGNYGDVTFTAQWTENTNTITFNADGGAAVADVTYKITDATADLPTTTKEGYKFGGWLVTTADGNWEADSVVFKRLTGKYGNVELTAQWTNGDFNVFFDGNGNTDGKQMGAQTFFSDVAQNLSKNIYTRAYTVTYDYAGATAGAAPAADTANYVFEGWATAANAATAAYADEASFTASRDDALTLFAVWTPTSVTLPTPTKTGYTFAGWFNGSTAVEGTTFTPAADTTLTAHWTQNDFTVTFAKGHDDATGEMANQTITADTATNLTANAFTRSYEVTYVTDGSAVTDATVDYTFAGWLDQDGNAYADKASISMARDDALNLTAQWTANSTELPATTKDGYTFAGWYNGSTKVGDAGDSFTPTADTELTAHWNAISYTATYIYANGNNNTTAAFTKEDAVTLPTPTKNGYTFAGWTITAAAGSWTNGTEYAADVTSIDAGNYGDVTFTAQWTRNAYNYTGKILADDASNAIEGTYNVDEAATLGTPTRAGYSFAGWRVAAATGLNNWDIGTVVFSIPAGKFGDVDFVAVWTNNDFNVTFAGNNNTNTNITMPAQQFRSGVAQTLNPNQYEREYAVTFEENGGSAVTDATVAYSFLGWSETANAASATYADQAEINMARNENLALYAIWQAASTTIPAAPTKFGYTFVGWYDNASFTGSAYEVGADFTPEADTVFYAKWVAQSFNVTFAGNGNTNDVTMAAQPYESGVAQALTANTFERAYDVTYDENGGSTVTDVTVAYDFLGWNEDAAATTATYTDGQTITLTRESNLALSAIWSANSTALPTPTKDGYTFAGWYNGSTKVDGTTFTPTADTELTAHWDAISYTATFVYKNGSDDTTVAFTKTDDVTFPVAPTRTGYDFAGWTITKVAGSWTNGTEYAATATKVDAGNYGDVTFTAQWTPVTYDYTLLPNSGTLTTADTGSYTIEETIQLPSQSANQITRTGYSFAGWKVTTSNGNWDADSVIFSIPTGKYGDVTLEAVWTESDFNVTFLGNGSNNGIQMPAQQFRSGIAQALFNNQYARVYTVTYNYDGATSGADTASTTVAYTFNGWLDQDGAAYTNGQTVSFERTEPVTMTAQWIANSTVLPTPTKTGYTFAGWYTDSSLATPVTLTGGRYTPTADITLYAKWDANDFTVTFDKNNADATGTMAAQTITCGDETPLTANAFERKYTVTYDENGGSAVTDATVDYTFAGWATAADGDVVYTDGQAITLDRDEDLTLYAVWTPESTALPTTSKDGYTFVGWYDGATKVEGAAFTPTANTTLTAQWTAIGYTATFVYANGTTEFTTTDFIATDVVAFPTTARAGYDFSGWKITAADGDWTNGTQYAADAANAGDAHYGDVTFTAQWTKITYTYKFETAGGTMADFDGEYNIESAPITLPTEYQITRDGYTFAGWKVTTVADATNWHLGDIVTKIPTGMYGNVRFTAQWTKNTFFVIFDGNHKTDGTMQNQQFIADEAQALNPNMYTRSYAVTFNYDGADGGEQPESLTANFGFAGWKYGDETFTNQQVVTFLSEDNVTIVAQWTPVSITLPTPTKTGYTFGGWYKDAALTEANKAGDGGDAYWPNEDTVNSLYAKWTANEYTYSYDVNGGSAVDGGTYTIETPTFALPTAGEISRDGYSFNGWTVKTATGDENSWTVGDAATEVATGSYGDVEFQAQWTANTYTYSFDPDEGTMTGDFGGTYTIESASIALPTADDISRDGYDFGGWIVSTSVGNWVANGDIISSIATGHWGDVTFKAKWLYGVFGVTYHGDNFTGDPATALGDTAYEGTVTAADGYHVLDTVTVKVSGIELTRDTDYTYTLAADNLSAAIYINADKVIGHVDITAETAAHDFTDHYVSNGDDTHEAYCVCGQHVTEDCTGGTATCIEKAVCELCGDHYGELADHIITTVNARAATCTQDGTRALTYCAVCNLILTLEGTDISASGKKYGVDTETYVLPALGHDYTGEMRDNGNGTHSFKCVNGCGTYGDPAYHTFDQQVSTRTYLHSNAKCETPATYYYSCACGAASTETYEVGEALGHAWVRKPAQASTCTTAGHSEFDYCERCDKTVGFEPYAVLGHGEYHFDSTRSGKLSDGSFKYDYYKCERCDDYYILITVAAIDQNNHPIKDVEVSLVNHGIKYTGVTNANGEVKFDQQFKEGEYKITMIYTVNRVMITTNDVLTLRDGNLTGTVSHMDTRATYTTDEQATGFRCSMCDFYEARYEIPVYGWAITVIHYFVHTIQQLVSKMGK